VLEIEDIHTYRGQSYVLQGVTMQVPDGACTTLLGRNGMGKTTLIRSLMGLSPPSAGHIRLDGEELIGMQPFEIAQKGLGLVPQGRHVFPSLTVEENLILAARKAARGNGEGNVWDLDRVYEVFPNLRDRRRNRGGELSGGEQQMLAIGRALMSNPRILLMDEPSEGLAPVIVERVEEVIRSLRGQRLSILLVEQNYRVGVSSADHVYILSKGVVVWEGSPQELEAAEDVKHTYLGV
jgi:branched-chain amino acid transport system ATP-binding protein